MSLAKRVVKPMLAHSDEVNLDHISLTHIGQRKYDGTRCLIFKTGDVIRMIGRSWKNDYAPNYPYIVAELKKIPIDFIVDSELTFFDSEGKDVFVTALATPATQRQYNVKVIVFDVLEIDGKDVTRVSLERRMELLAMLFGRAPTKHIELAETYNTGLAEKFRSIVEKGGEGLILKKRGSRYVENSREFWIKVKREETVDCIVLGITKGEGERRHTFGSLILGRFEKGRIRISGKTSGFDQKTLDSIYGHIMKMPEARYPFKLPNVKRWVAPSMVVEVRCMSVTENGMLRHPSFVRIRTDKAPQECVV